jgi:hypothetical protein
MTLQPISAHILGLTFLSGCYVGWTWVGYVVCDKYAYYFFDHHEHGWQYYGIAVLSFIIVTNTCKSSRKFLMLTPLTNLGFFFVYGLTGIREMLTRKSSGYTRLPQ